MKDIHDVIKLTKSGDDRLRGSGVVAGQISAFPIDFAGRPYNTLTQPCERVIQHGVSNHSQQIRKMHWKFFSSLHGFSLSMLMFHQHFSTVALHCKWMCVSLRWPFIQQKVVKQCFLLEMLHISGTAISVIACYCMRVFLWLVLLYIFQKHWFSGSLNTKALLPETTLHPLWYVFCLWRRRVVWGNKLAPVQFSSVNGCVCHYDGHLHSRKW